MYLLEHDAKELLAARGIAVPAGCLIESAAVAHGASLPSGPWVVKGQVATGGRGKAGIIRKASSIAELEAQARHIIGANVKGQRVAAARIEQQVSGAREVYVGFLLDAASGGVRVILSASGGVDIEQVPPEHIQSAVASPEVRSLVECVRRLARNLPDEIARAASEAGGKLARAFVELEAVLIEINPLFVHPDGKWVAGDTKIITDDNALPRQAALESLVKTRAAAYPDVARKHEHGFDYVVLDPEGEIGLLTTGAGLSMMLIDELRAAGLKPYNFLDIRTGLLRGEPRRLTQALKWIGEGRKVKVLLVNIFAGITDLGEFSRLLVEAIAAAPQLKVPVIARLVGNGLPAAREVLAAARIGLYTNLDEALAAVRAHLSQSRNRQD